MNKNEKKLIAAIAAAVAGLEKARNPHAVKVREDLRAAIAEPIAHPLDCLMLSADGKARHYYGATDEVRAV